MYQELVSRFSKGRLIVILCIKLHNMLILALSFLLTHNVWIYVSTNPAVVLIHNSTDTKGASSEKQTEVEYCMQNCHATRDHHLQSTKVDSRQKKCLWFSSVTFRKLNVAARAGNVTFKEICR